MATEQTGVLYNYLDTRIQFKRDTAANWTTNNPVLLENELILVDTSSGETRMKLGDGIKRFMELPFLDEVIRNLIPTDLSHLGFYVSADEPAEFTSGQIWLDTSSDSVSVLKYKNSDNEIELVTPWGLATQTSPGVMSANDKKKLDELSESGTTSGPLTWGAVAGKE